MCRKIPQHTTSNREGKSYFQEEKSIGQIFRDYGEEYIRTYNPPLHHIKLIRAIRICKTPQLGGVAYTCKMCNAQHYIYKSCGHSQCMLCQAVKREQWVDKLNNRLLHVPYVHMIFTLPHAFNGLCRKNQIELYNMVMKSSWQTVIEILKPYGITPGMSSVLHTFGSNMNYHIHVHALVTYGGLDENNEWVYPNVKYGLEKYRNVCAIWKRIVLENIKTLYDENEITYHEDHNTLISTIQKTRWVVHTTRPTCKTETIEKYLAKYINRIGVSANRVKYIKGEKEVILQYNDYKKQEKNKAAPKAYAMMHPLVFIDQLLQHVLPRHFQKSRNYGLHKLSTKQKEKIPDSIKRNGFTIRTLFEIITHLMGLEKPKCLKCGHEEFNKQEILPNRRWILKYLKKEIEERPPPSKKSNIKPLVMTLTTKMSVKTPLLKTKEKMVIL